MKEFTLDIPRIDSNETIIEDVKGFNVKQVTVVATADGTKVRVQYEGVTHEDGKTA